MQSLNIYPLFFFERVSQENRYHNEACIAHKFNMLFPYAYSKFHCDKLFSQSVMKFKFLINFYYKTGLNYCRIVLSYNIVQAKPCVAIYILGEDLRNNYEIQTDYSGLQSKLFFQLDR